MTKEELQMITQKLIEFGEDSEEIKYWIDIYDNLPETQKEEIGKTFKEELQEFESLKQ